MLSRFIRTCLRSWNRSHVFPRMRSIKIFRTNGKGHIETLNDYIVVCIIEDVTYNSELNETLIMRVSRY